MWSCPNLPRRSIITDPRWLSWTGSTATVLDVCCMVCVFDASVMCGLYILCRNRWQMKSSRISFIALRSLRGSLTGLVGVLVHVLDV